MQTTGTVVIIWGNINHVLITNTQVNKLYGFCFCQRFLHACHQTLASAGSGSKTRSTPTDVTSFFKICLLPYFSRKPFKCKPSILVVLHGFNFWLLHATNIPQKFEIQYFRGLHLLHLYTACYSIILLVHLMFATCKPLKLPDSYYKLPHNLHDLNRHQSIRLYTHL